MDVSLSTTIDVLSEILTYTGTGGSTETSFTMKFQALKEGSTKVEVSGATIASDVGTTLTLDQGNSTVKIAAGDPSKIKSDSKSSMCNERKTRHAQTESQ